DDLVIVRRKNQGSYLARATSERSFEMNSLNAKVALAALGFVVVATPALAQRLHRPVSNAAVQIPPAEHYPNGAEQFRVGRRIQHRLLSPAKFEIENSRAP